MPTDNSHRLHDRQGIHNPRHHPVSVYSLGEEASAEDWFLPTLSELIAACEGKFFSLISDCGKWRCTASGYEGYDDLYSTPSEAVARLWLALNKKP